MSYTIPGCYTTTGQPVVVNSRAEVIKPWFPEGLPRPTPAAGATNALGIISKLPPQPNLK